MNLLGLSVIGAAILAIALGFAGASYEKKDADLAPATEATETQGLSQEAPETTGTEPTAPVQQ